MIKMLVSEYLTPVFLDAEISIKETDGRATIVNAGDVFLAGIDPNFKNLELNTPDKPTEKMLVQVFEMVKDGNFRTLFGSFGGNLDNLCLTQGQIIEFCRDSVAWLHPEGWPTFFLFKAGEYFFVARIRRQPEGWGIRVFYLPDKRIWKASYRLRLVLSASRDAL